MALAAKVVQPTLPVFCFALTFCNYLDANNNAVPMVQFLPLTYSFDVTNIL
jgi:hypothetical protein